MHCTRKFETNIYRNETARPRSTLYSHVSLSDLYIPTLQRINTENMKQIFLEKELCGPSPNFHIHVSVSDLYIPKIYLPILLQEICGPILGKY
jgi:hypothetical protein